MRVRLRVWRQGREERKGRLVDYEMPDVSPDMSFLEMLDVLNDSLERRGEEPIAFEHDCREGICGSCGFMIDGRAHGPLAGTTVCQLHMRHFSDGDTLVVEPWRARAFPVIKDLVVDRGAFDRIIQSGGYISVNTGSAPEANAVPVAKVDAEASLDAAACIGCGACVAACKNASAMLFTSAKLTHLGRLPQGSRSGAGAPAPWCAPWTPRGSATARTRRNARRSAPRASPSTPSRASTASSWPPSSATPPGNDSTMTQRWRKLGVIIPQRDAAVWNQRPSAPCVFRTEDRYLMYLHGLQFFSEQRKLTRIGLAEAPLDDPLDWRMVSEEPLIDLGGEGATDSHMAAYPWVVRITDTHWHLYYAAWDGSFVPHAPHQKRYQTCMARE